MKRARLVACTLAAFAGIALSIAPASAQSSKVYVQPPCTSGAPCLLFDSTSQVVTVRTIDIVAPVSGTAIMTYHGSLYCYTPVKADAVVSLESQIVGITNNDPDGGATSGLISIGILSSSAEHSLAGGEGFNLASTRAINVTAGQTVRYAFRLERLAMSAGVECRADRNNAFTVQFVE